MSESRLSKVEEAKRLLARKMSKRGSKSRSDSPPSNDDSFNNSILKSPNESMLLDTPGPQPQAQVQGKGATPATNRGSFGASPRNVGDSNDLDALLLATPFKGAAGSSSLMNSEEENPAFGSLPPEGESHVLVVVVVVVAFWRWERYRCVRGVVVFF
jgi:hypothetical protein